MTPQPQNYKFAIFWPVGSSLKTPHTPPPPPPPEFQFGFRKGYSPQHSLLLIIDKWKKPVDSHKVLGAVLTDFIKSIWLHLPWFAFSKTLCLRIIFFCLTTNKGLPLKQKTVNSPEKDAAISSQKTHCISKNNKSNGAS